ncbi:MAG: GH25 family lysozyme [Byssovorax sp.]
MPKRPLAALAALSLGISMALGCAAPDTAGDDEAPIALDPQAAGPGFEEDAVRQCALGPTLLGIDVSYYQETIDWPAAAQAGVAFAFARVSDGSGFSDPDFARNWAGMRAAGVIRGAYQFFRPAEDPKAQADLLIAQIRENGGLGPGDLPPALDIEVMDGVTAPVVLARMQVWLDRVEAALGKRPLIYTAPGFWEDLDAPPSFGRYPLWLANWGRRCPATPETWARWSFWQSSDRGSVAGIEGPVDLDRWNGSRADLLAFASAGSMPVSPPPPKVEKPKPASKPARVEPRKAPAAVKISRSEVERALRRMMTAMGAKR